MAEQQILALGPAFARYLDSSRNCFADHRAIEYLPRKSVEPITLASGAAVRTFLEFLRDYAAVRDRPQRRLAAKLGDAGPVVVSVGVRPACPEGDATPRRLKPKNSQGRFLTAHRLHNLGRRDHRPG